MLFKLPFISVGYYCPTFKGKKSRLSEVLEPAPGHTVSCKAGLEPCLSYIQVHAFTLPWFSWMVILPWAKWWSTWLHTEKATEGLYPRHCQGVSSPTPCPSIITWAEKPNSRRPAWSTCSLHAQTISGLWASRTPVTLLRSNALGVCCCH